MKKILGFAFIVCAACSGASPTAPATSAPPVISDISVAALTASSAQLTWLTDKESDSQVEYGTTSGYGAMSPADTETVTSHRVSLDGLSGGTSYHYRVRSKDKEGNLAFSENLTFVTPKAEAPDQGNPVALPPASPPSPPRPPSNPPPTAPVVVVTKPAAGAIVSGTVTVAADATADGGVVGVQFKRNGSNLGSEDRSAPYSIEWNTTAVANGSNVITAVARSASGRSTTSPEVTVTVSNNSPGNPDITPPSVSISAPGGGSTVSGTIAVTASATDAGGVAAVQFKVDGVNVGAEDTAAPYSVVWNTTGVANGSHTVVAIARDAAGNSATSESVTVSVANDQGSPEDKTAPSVSVTAPGANATLSGTVPVTAAAFDNVGIAGVQFKVDGADLGAEDPTTPYSVQWNTNNASNGIHTIVAVARDAAGNSATSTEVIVTVKNDLASPSVSITSPAAGATLSGTVSVTANASDDLGVSGVQFRVDGVNLGAEDTSSPYSATWNTTTATNGIHTLSAIARDGSGKTTASAAVSITVSNVVLPPPPSGGIWPNEPAGYVTLSDQAWGALSSLGWFHQNRGASSFITTDLSAPLSSATVLAHSYPNGFSGGVEPAVDWYPLPSNFKEGYVGMWWKPSESWQNHPSNVNKIFFIFGSAGHIIPVMYGTGGGTFQLRVAPEWGGWSWLTPNVGSGNITLGQWHRIEVYFKQQTSGGIIRWWMDGNLIGNYTNVSFPSSMQFEELQIAPTWGGVGGTKSKQDYFWFDHVHLSRP